MARELHLRLKVLDFQYLLGYILRFGYYPLNS